MLYKNDRFSILFIFSKPPEGDEPQGILIRCPNHLGSESSPYLQVETGHAKVPTRPHHLIKAEIWIIKPETFFSTPVPWQLVNENVRRPSWVHLCTKNTNTALVLVLWVFKVLKSDFGTLYSCITPPPPRMPHGSCSEAFWDDYLSHIFLYWWGNEKDWAYLNPYEKVNGVFSLLYLDHW